MTVCSLHKVNTKAAEITILGDEDYEKRVAEFKEYESRLVPASDEEVIALAERIWADSALKAIFKRIGYDGDLTEAEEATVDTVIDSYRKGPLWDRDRLHLALAPCLVRRLAAGMIDRLDGPQVRAFLADHRVTRSGSGVSGAKTTASEVMDFAKAVRADAQCWAIIMRLKDYRFEKGGDPEGILARFETCYRYKYGLLNRHPFGSAIGMLRGVASGSIPSIDSPEAWASIKKVPWIKD